MIKLSASSSNQFTMQPSGSYSNGSSYLYKFTDVFSQDEYVGQTTGSNAGPWVRLFVDIDGSYTIDEKQSTLPLKGGTYELQVYHTGSGISVYSIYGSEPREWNIMGSTWSSVPGIPTTTGNSIMTTRAWVSESIDDTNYSSTNENAAYVVYEG